MPLSFPLIMLPSCMGDTCGFALLAVNFLYKSAIVVFIFFVSASSTASCWYFVWCSEFCREKLQQECSTTFRVISRAEDAQLYLDVYHKYSRVFGKVPCVQPDMGLRGSSSFVGGVGDGSDSSLCGPSVSLPGRSNHANPNAVTITVLLLHEMVEIHEKIVNSALQQVFFVCLFKISVSNNGSSASRRGRNVQVHRRLISAAGVQTTSRRTRRRVLTSANIVDPTSVASAGGRIHMQPPREPPEYIKSLFGNKHFMENIRAYNQMFTMTSFGAKIEESINAGRGIDNSQLEPEIVEGLIHFLDAYNELVQLFRTTRDRCRELDIPEFKIRLYNAKGARGNELPTSNTLGAMVFKSGIADNADFDVIIQHRDGPIQRVNKLHPSYMSLQFPLLFIYGQPGYHTELKLKSANGVGERDGYEVGGRIILPMSFTGGLRYMYAHYLDALAIFRKLGNPQFFITFTCNVKWPEIKRFMSEYPHLTASDRADVVCRVFEQKIQALVAFLKEERIFGNVTGVLYTVKFQKRGLPHSHTLLWVDSASRIRIAEEVD
ncbi:DNA helicase [Tanacetum coccineum]